MSGSTEQPLSTLPVVSATTGLRILGFDSTGKPSAVEPLAFAAAPTEGAALSDATPVALGATGTAGVSTAASRADHRHPRPGAAEIGAAAISHTHVIADTTNLQATLDGKAPTSHTHAISGVNGLQAALDTKASSAHSHPISDVANLQSTLDAKQALAQKGLANGYAPLDASGRVPVAYIPPITATVTNVADGAIANQVPFWDTAAGRYQPRLLTASTAERTPTVERNSATVLSFAEYNRRNIVLSGAAALTLAAAEIGVSPNQGMEFIINNRHTQINTITFGAGILVDPYPLGTGTAGAVKIAAKGCVAVTVYYCSTEGLVATVRGQIV